MQLITGVLKNLVKNEQKFIFLFLLKIKIEIWNSFFNLIMKTKSGTKTKFYFILKWNSNVPFDRRIIVQRKCHSIFILNWNGKRHFCSFQFLFENWKLKNDKIFSNFNFQFFFGNWKMEIHFSCFNFRISLLNNTTRDIVISFLKPHLL